MSNESGANGASDLKGNTKLKSQKKRVIQSKNWIFTFNNYSKNDIFELIKFFESKNILYGFGEEIAPTTGTPHLQGFIHCPSKVRPLELKLNNTIHWKKMKGTINDNIKYCSKEENYYCSYSLEQPSILNIKLYDWQLKIEAIHLSRPNGRTIHWVCDWEGGKGKSTFCKYMYYKYNIPTIQGGKLSDIMNIVFNMDVVPKTFLIDIPRCNKNKVSYASIECILNGMITNTKFETGIKVFNPPHVFCFSNFEPETEKLSEDRWNIIHLE